LPLRDVVIFPKTTTTVLVGRKKSVIAVENAKKAAMPIFVVTQTDPDHDGFEPGNMHTIGTLCNIIESMKTSDGTIKVVIQGIARGEMGKIIPSEEFFSCEVKILTDETYSEDDEELQGLMRGCVKSFTQYSEFDKRITQETINTISKVKSPYDLAHMMTPFLNSHTKEKQEILQENDAKKKLYKALELLKLELNILQAEVKISKKVQERISKSQKDLYLSEQLKYIKKELGQDEDGELLDLKRKIAALKLPKEVAEKCKNELSKLEKTNLFSSEAGVIRNYLDWIVSLPWTKKTIANNSLDKAAKLLDKNHYALQKIKDRILEFIAVQIKTKELRGPIICLVGAPGVGKTSLAKSIADALNRKYVKVSLGGVRDESEIRGHRRTYIGSLPGRIIQSMKKAKVINPLMLLDEIDKMSYDLRGDPSSALLEVLDPEQNVHFSDHYLEVDYDLSKVMFVATANNIAGIPAPLKDRMEIIRLSGYTENEKLQIAKKHLLPNQRKEHGLSNEEFKITDSALIAIIRKYTFEAGVRNLNREIANAARKAVREIISKKITKLEITEENLSKYAGAEKFHFGIAKVKDQVGIATGLAYTDFGGDLLDIEAVKFIGSGKIQITGKLGDVMKESAQAALSYVRSIADDLKISAKEFNKYDFHIHVPEGATPKDGPSAGVALCLALFSCIAGFPVSKDIAVTGEITLTGKVLEIGGLKEKLLAALRGEIKTVIIPENNKKDIDELPKEVLDNINIRFVSNVKEAFEIALVGYTGSKKKKKKSSNSKPKQKATKNKFRNVLPELDTIS
jgi:ATP-dependent Lon protease